MTMTSGFQKLKDLKAEQRKQLVPKIKKLESTGARFILCWNFSNKVLERFRYYKGLDLTKIENVRDKATAEAIQGSIRNIYTNEADFGQELILVFLNHGATTVGSQGRIYPTIKVQEALIQIGLTPVKSKMTGSSDLVSYKFAEAEEVVAFM